VRFRHSLAVAFGLLLPAACTFTDGDVTLPPFDVRLQQLALGSLSGPIDLQAPPGDARLFIAERAGRLRIVQGGVLLPTAFLDISNRVLTDGEAGLLSFAFHPQFASNPQQRFVFVHFIENIPNTSGDIVVERYQVSSTNPNVLDTSGTEVIRIPHRDMNFTNHYGGRVAFGPDGMLYLSTGDGGGGGDTLMNGQKASTLLGKLLRLDVSMHPTPPYTIPADNPTWPGAMPRGENWAIGLRNPFRYSFDAPTGQLYIADVGQSQREEIDVVAAGAAGLNYGWNLMEGMRCFPNGGQCNTMGLTLPVYDYDHGQGCSIIGGYVYRGAAMPELQGQYLFSDYCSGFVRGLSFENGIATVRQAPMVNAGTNVVQSFGQDGAGELYILTGDGRVLQIVRP
jgi:glucose/arabinose dehydrogenase